MCQLLIEEPNNSDVVQQILRNAGISPILVLGYVCQLAIKINVKKPKSWGQSAGVRVLSTIFSETKRRKSCVFGLKVMDFVTKKAKYFQCELGIELSIKDVQLIYKIKDLLGVGLENII